jgi:hypothetical protein
VRRRSRVRVCSYVEMWNPCFVSMSLDSPGSLDLMNRRLRFNVPANVCAFICSLDLII